MLYDLHMHSCLSPCAEDDMTPANIAGLAKLAGAELIAVTDHNAADNLPAVQCCCNAYGLRLLPGVEVNTAEEFMFCVTSKPWIQRWNSAACCMPRCRSSRMIPPYGAVSW